MSNVVMVNSHTTKESQTFTFAGANADEIADKSALVMARRGYHLESGTKLQGVYGRGSAAAFAILGPLVNRQKYNLTIAKDAENVAVVLAKGMAGLGGGLLGAGKVKREFQEIIADLQESILSS